MNPSLIQLKAPLKTKTELSLVICIGAQLKRFKTLQVSHFMQIKAGLVLFFMVYPPAISIPYSWILLLVGSG